MDLITLLLLLLALLALAGLAAAVVRTVRGDGLGHGCPPASHLSWDARVRSF